MLFKAILLIVLSMLVPVCNAQQRHALVIGNDSYPGNSLKNARNDATSIFDILKSAGYESTLVLDANRSTLSGSIDSFVDTLQPGDTALLYYAGHGFQLDGENFLVPTDFKVISPSDAKIEGYSLSTVLERFTSHGATTQVVILDACRDNPFLGNRSTKGGWAGVGTSAGSLLAFGTSPGATASDNPADGHGLFTKDLLPYLGSSDLDIEEMLRKVREDVIRDSNGQQVPWVASSLIGSFHVRPDLDIVRRFLPDPNLHSVELSPVYMRSMGNDAQASSTSPGTSASPAVLQNYRDAVTLARGSHFSEAVSILQGMISLAPNYTPALRLLGLLLHTTGRDVEAIDALNQAVASNGSDTDAEAERCALEALTGQPRANEDCQLGVQRAPTSASYFVLAINQESLGQVAKAYGSVSQSIALEPSDLSLALRGILASRIGQDGSAERDFLRAYQINSSLTRPK